MYGTGGQHLTPELVLQPRFMQHPNGARLMTEAVVCASDPEEYARKYSVYTGHDYQRTGGHFDVDFGGTPRVTVTTPEQVASIVPGGIAPADPALVGFTVFVADPQRRGVPGGRQPAESPRPTRAAAPCCSSHRMARQPTSGGLGGPCCRGPVADRS